MKKLMRTSFLIFLLSLIVSGVTVASAREREKQYTHSSEAVVSKGQAIAAVKTELRGKVLSIKLIPSEGPPVYRVKILLSKGRVRTVFVDGITAQVIRIR